MAKALGAISACILVASVFVNVCVFIPTFPISMDTVGVLHFAAMFAGGSMVLALAALSWRCARQGQNIQKTQTLIWGHTPRLVRVAMVAAVINAVINFVLAFMQTDGAVPERRDEHYVLQNHGQVIRVLTEKEYRRCQAYEVLQFSGIWIFASLASTYFFWQVYPRACQICRDRVIGDTIGLQPNGIYINRFQRNGCHSPAARCWLSSSPKFWRSASTKSVHEFPRG